MTAHSNQRTHAQVVCIDVTLFYLCVHPCVRAFGSFCKVGVREFREFREFKGEW